MVSVVTSKRRAASWSVTNGYGTHDWILDKVIRTLKRRTNKVNWVKLQVALWAFDDQT